ncbi:MAG TPA: hypothetical protein VNC23_08255 [Lapillicoccus sp.]|jgi:hypothetical protein|nr:hypothetical protein [Lapillicoccus sp.]
MSQQPQPHTSAFFGTAVLFLAVTGVWNFVNVWLLDVSVQQRWTMGMSILCAMFAVVVVSKVVRDREEANRTRVGQYDRL